MAKIETDPLPSPLGFVFLKYFANNPFRSASVSVFAAVEANTADTSPTICDTATSSSFCFVSIAKILPVSLLEYP
jgi:hypothetical protein